MVVSFSENEAVIEEVEGDGFKFENVIDGDTT